MEELPRSENAVLTGLPCRYVGGAPGKIDLYVGKEVVRRAIPMDDATNQLIELIKEHDR